MGDPEGVRTGHGKASGKIILLGEHAVVYGVPAIALGLDRGAEATAKLASRGSPGALSLGGGAHTAGVQEDEIARAYAALLGAHEDTPACDAIAQSTLPPRGGLGSSAALGMAIARAVEGVIGTDPQLCEGRALARARAWEGVFHGTPSGIDTAAAAYGGCLRFSKAEGARPLRLGAELLVCVGWTGSGSSTRHMVEAVARLAERKPDLVKRAMDGVRSLVDNAVLALEAGDLSAVGKLMDYNQMILAGLMLSNETIERMCADARAAGALGAKLTGAGGGGSVVALAADALSARAILAAWSAGGFGGFEARAGGGAAT